MLKDIQGCQSISEKNRSLFQTSTEEQRAETILKALDGMSIESALSFLAKIETAINKSSFNVSSLLGS